MKVKNVRNTDVVVGGWVGGDGGRTGKIGALVIGFTTDDGDLRYAGKVGTGFNEAELKRLQGIVDPLARESSPFTGTQPEKADPLHRAGARRERRLRRHHRGGNAAPSGLPGPARRPRAGGRGRPGRTVNCALVAPTRQNGGMARSMWSGAISFGLVNVPIKLYSAVSKKTVRFHQLNGETGSRIAQKRVDSVTGEEVPYENLVKGYELTKDRYVLINPDELETLEPEKSRTIDIEDFVDLADIDPVYYDHPYYLVPGQGRREGLRAAAERDEGVRPRRDRARDPALQGAARRHPARTVTARC